MNFDYKFEVNIGQKVIKCRAFTLEEYKDLMQAKLNGKLKETIESILWKCTNCAGLNKQESELLIVKLWAHSTGEVNSDAVHICDCGKENLVSINMNYAQLDDAEEVIYDFNNFKIKFKYPRLFADSNIARMIGECIDYIIVGNEKLLIDDLTEQELNDLYSAITTEDIQKIAEMLLKPSIYLAVPVECECGKNHLKIIRGLKEFFRLL